MRNSNANLSLPLDPDVLCVGIDENGLGPRLGPLIVTAIAARTSAAHDELGLRTPTGASGSRIGDSKKLVSFRDSDLGEAWGRVLNARAKLQPPRTPDELVSTLSIDARAVLEKPCPNAHRAQCWGTDTEAFTSDPRRIVALENDARELEQRGIDLLGAHVAIICTERLNEGAKRGVSRFEMDLHAMERLLLHARARYGAEVDAVCGKVGGYNSYPNAFGPLAGTLTTVLEEGRARSAYRVAGLGRVAFVRDADGSHLLVALASLVGKWVRDFLMRRVTRYHRAVDPTLPEVSGYHDPNTARFVASTALARKERGLPNECFERASRATPNQRK